MVVPTQYTLQNLIVLLFEKICHVHVYGSYTSFLKRVVLLSPDNIFNVIEYITCTAYMLGYEIT